MISLFGAEATAEYAAAKSISESFASYWPGLAESPRTSDDLRISANTKISGYGINDIDIMICGRFRPGRKFIPTRSINDKDGMTLGAKPVRVDNLIIAIEVKSHSADRIQFENNSVKVRYARNGV